MKKTARQNASESKTRKGEAPMIEMSVDLSNMERKWPELIESLRKTEWFCFCRILDYC